MPWRRIPTPTSCSSRRRGPPRSTPSWPPSTAGKTIALANKEILVMAGSIVMDRARRRGVAVLPVDSEHNAIHQCMHGREPREIRRLILTASGGPFRELPAARLAARLAGRCAAPPDVADGAEDHDRLGDVDEQGPRSHRGALAVRRRAASNRRRRSIPQSIVHSMVELVDGSIIAQLGVTDMRLPIQYAFSYPERWSAPLDPLDLTRAGRLEFEPPDTAAFPAWRWRFGRSPGTSGCRSCLNAANEIAVAEFLQSRLGFTSIPRRHRAVDGRLRTQRCGRRLPGWMTCAPSIGGRGSSLFDERRAT